MHPIEFRQASWSEPLLFEYKGQRRGIQLPRLHPKIAREVGDPLKRIPSRILRENPPLIPGLSEIEVVKHFTRLSQMNYGVDTGVYPLGSCTMKYNPRVCEDLAHLPQVELLHPLQDEALVQGALELMYRLERWLCALTGMHRFTLQPAAGAQGELTGCLIMRAYFKYKGEEQRDEMLVPDSAHGTNPSSAAMCGFKVIELPSDESGCVSLKALKAALSERTAGLMLTNPNTLGLFEESILEIADLVHEAGGLLYYDGANLQGVMGKARPGDMGFDIVHLNLHKTFSTPHGGGGPGSGPVGVTQELEKFLPVPLVEFDGSKYYLDYDRPFSIGKVHGFYGNFSVLVKAFAYILLMGFKGLRRACEVAVVNTNYFAKKVREIKGFTIPFNPYKPRKHEVVVSAEQLLNETGVSAMDVAKRLMDFGLHPPTVYFPLIVKEPLMMEFTESATKEEIDAYLEALRKISEESYSEPQKVKSAPHSTSVRRVDDVRANHPRTLCLSYRMMMKKQLSL